MHKLNGQFDTLTCYEVKPLEIWCQVGHDVLRTFLINGFDRPDMGAVVGGITLASQEAKH